MLVAAVILYTLHIPVAHAGMISAAPVMSDTWLNMLRITSAHGQMISRAAVISYTL